PPEPAGYVVEMATPLRRATREPPAAPATPERPESLDRSWCNLTHRERRAWLGTGAGPPGTAAARLLAALERARPDLARDAREWAVILGAVPRERPFTSRLNNDGSPLQVCVTERSGRQRVHLLADPGSDASD